MILDGLPYAEYAAMKKGDKRTQAIAAFLDYVQRKLGVLILRDPRFSPDGREDLAASYLIAQQLIRHGVIESFSRSEGMPDEPRFILWSAVCNNETKHQVGGASVDTDDSALRAVLAEGLERYLWYTQRDYFVNPQHCTTREIATLGAYIAPERFTSFLPSERDTVNDLRLYDDAAYLWIQASSLVTGTPVYIPAQVASAAIRPRTEAAKEPLIRTQVTIGLATWPTQDGARLAGIAELLEREAYMIMWLNQLTLPRVDLKTISGKNASLDTMLRRCERYGLRVHAIRMLTDAPLHAVCVVVEDTWGAAPRFAFGLKAHRSLPYAIERALIEALRARRGYRKYFAAGNTWDTDTPVEKIGHRERIYYWGEARHAPHLEFLIRGPLEPYSEQAWERDTTEQHLERLITWCKTKEFECVSVSLGTSAKNPTDWHVENVIMPDLVSTYLTEWRRHLAGSRLVSVPEAFGYTPRTTPFIDAPHPYS